MISVGPSENSTVFSYLGFRGITPVMFSREQLKRAAILTEEDFVQLGKCRRPHNRLGFATRSPSSGASIAFHSSSHSSYWRTCLLQRGAVGA